MGITMHILCFDIAVNSVTCPGVWLCPKGQIILKLSVFGTSKRTKKTYPKFPLIFNETFSFQKLIVGGLRTVAEVLETEEVCIELIQWMVFHHKFGVVLAKVDQRLSEIFKPFIINEKVTIASKVDLLTSRTEYFPGIISPKLNAKINVKIYPYHNQINSWLKIPPKQTISNRSCRQHAVCHSNSRYQFNNYDSIPNDGCFLCSLSQVVVEKFERLQVENQCSKFDMKNSFCSWCDYAVPSCKCSSCWKYHTTFH